jgi:signal recognition particle subunit SRP68
MSLHITAFTVGNREAALLIADYNAYRRQLSRQLLALRKRLGRSTNKGQKYSNKSTVTPEEVAQNPQYRLPDLVSSATPLLTLS